AGRVSTGVATVNSTASSAPALCAISAAAAMSVTPQVRLAGVSSHTSLVTPGFTAAAMASSLSASTNSTLSPQCVAKPASQLRSDQYITFGAMTWSPGARARKQALAALMPDEKTSAFGPPSSAASVASA